LIGHPVVRKQSSQNTYSLDKLKEMSDSDQVFELSYSEYAGRPLKRQRTNGSEDDSAHQTVCLPLEQLSGQSIGGSSINQVIPSINQSPIHSVNRSINYFKG
jgi:hypothetical protein